LPVHLRLFRMGKKKQPSYRIVAADSRRARDGRFLEIVGTYNPIIRPAVVNLKEQRINHWLDEGAIPTDTVKSLLTQVGFTEKRLKAKRGEDVSGVDLKNTITERSKKTRKIKKAALAAADEAKSAESETPAADASDGDAGAAPAAE